MTAALRRSRRTSEERLERLLALQSMMARLAREIGPARELQPVLTAVLRELRSLIEFKGGSLCLVENGEVFLAASDPPVSPDVASLRLPVGEGLVGRVIATGEPMYSRDIRDDSRVRPDIAILGSNVTIRSFLAVPLVCLGEVTGVIQVDSGEVDAFDEDDLRVLSGVAAQVAGAIESARHNEKVLELERLKSDFVAQVSHELRTPITVITGFTAILMEHGRQLDETEQHQLLRRIEAASGRLQYLIDELLTVSGVEAGMTVAQPTVVRLIELLHDVRADATDPARVEVLCADDLTMTVDPRLLRHMLYLLVDNALKFAGTAELTAEARHNEVVLAVRDHGPGVPRELRERIFERFVRGLDPEHPGLGLGLSLVQTIAGSLGATVEVDDAPGGGARFRLRFAEGCDGVLLPEGL